MSGMTKIWDASMFSISFTICTNMSNEIATKYFQKQSILRAPQFLHQVRYNISIFHTIMLCWRHSIYIFIALIYMFLYFYLHVRFILIFLPKIHHMFIHQKIFDCFHFCLPVSRISAYIFRENCANWKNKNCVVEWKEGQIVLFGLVYQNIYGKLNFVT